MKKNEIIDIVELRKQVNNNFLKFYVEKNYIYCENTYSKERVIVGKNSITIGIDLGNGSDKTFESLATLNNDSISRTRGVYHG